MLGTEIDLTKSAGRLANLNERRRALLEIIEERAVAFADDPVGSTGLYQRHFMIRGSREYPVIVEEYALDRPLLRELRETEKQAAIEMREREKEREQEDGEPDVQGLMGLLDAGRDRVAKMHAERQAAAAAAKAIIKTT